MRFQRNQHILWVILAAFALPQGALGQSQSIVGTVADSSGAVVPGATVTAINVQTGMQRHVTTNAAGEYTIPNLDVGLYTVTAVAKGFQLQEVKDVHLEVEAVRQINFVLQVGSSTQQVSVKATATPLETEQSSTGTLLETKMVEQLPLNGRNFLQLQLLSPGVSSTHNAGNVSVDRIDAQSRDIGGGLFSVGGMRDDYNDFLLDGISFREKLHGGNEFNPSVDAIQEFRTQTSDWSAQYGANAGGLVNVVMKSGTNSFHGSAYEFLRNDALDANNYFSNAAGLSKNPLHRNQFGGTLAGPIQRDKTFFFLSYDGFRETAGSTLIGNYPTPAMRTGDFSMLASQPTPTIISDPTTGKPFPGNIIPTNRILSVWPNYFSKYVPLPNLPGVTNNYIVPRVDINSTDQGMARIDHQFSERTSASFHYVNNHDYDAPTHINPFLYFTQQNRSQNVMVNLTHTFSPTTVFDYHGGYNLWKAFATTNTSGTTPYIARDILGIQGLATDPRASNAPYFIVTGFSNIGANIVQGPRAWYSEFYANNVTFYLTRGKHSLEAGIDLMRNHDTFPEIYIGSGLEIYSGIMTGYGFTDMLLGYPSNFQLAPQLFDPQFRSWNVAPWAQDTWRVTPNLTIDLGIRYDLWTRPVSKHNSISDIRIPEGGGQASIVLAGPCAPSASRPCQTTLPTSIDPDRSLIDGDHNVFAPRVGIAYNIGGANRTVLRAAYGIFYQNEPLNQFVFLSINPPFVSFYNQTYNLSNFQQFNFFNPTAGLQAGGVQYTYLPQHYPNAYLQSWNVGFEQQLAYGMVMDVAYVGNKDTHLVARTWPNQPLPGPGAVQPRRPYQNVSTIAGDEPIGDSNYNSLQVKVEKRYSQGLALLSAYTWSKALTDSQTAETGELGAVDLQNNYNRRANYGLFAGDVRHRFTVSAIYELPFGNGKSYGSSVKGPLGVMVSGWQLGTIMTFQTGQPYTASMAVDVANVGDGAHLPNLIANPNTGPKTPSEFFNIHAFAMPAPYTFGNEGIGVITGPGMDVVDLSAVKNTSVKERLNLQFRAEFFNAFNHANFAGPNTTFGSAQFGEITSTAVANREIQLALHLSF